MSSGWDHGIAGDDTHGHVDDITRFVSPDTVVTAVESDPSEANYEPLRENIRRLRSATDQDGKPLAIVDLPMPAPVIFEGRGSPPATLISISPTALSWSQYSMIPTTAWLSTFLPICFLIATLLASTAATCLGVRHDPLHDATATGRHLARNFHGRLYALDFSML